MKSLLPVGWAVGPAVGSAVGSALCAALVFGVVADSAQARAIESRDILKTYFETGDVPTQDQFYNLIDSELSFLTGGLTVLGLAPVDLGVPPSPGTPVAIKRFGMGTEVPSNPLGYLSPSDYTLVAETEFAGEFGFMAVLFGDSGGLHHYGFVQMHMDGAGRGVDLGIHVEYLVYETTPGVALTTFIVPGPSCAALFGVAAIRAARRRR